MARILNCIGNTQLEKRWLQTIDEVAEGRCMDAEVVFVIVLTYCAMIFNYLIFSREPELKLDNPLNHRRGISLANPEADDLTGRGRRAVGRFHHVYIIGTY